MSLNCRWNMTHVDCESYNKLKTETEKVSDNWYL